VARRVVWTVTAAESLEEIDDFIEQQSPDRARKIIRSLREAAARLGDFPQMEPAFVHSHAVTSGSSFTTAFASSTARATRR